MSQVLAFILLIGPLIFIHEFGHLIAAKLVDVKVHRFSIGFGPPLLRWRLRETEYCLAPIPLGGYVRMLGQNPYEQIPDSERDRALCNKPLWARYVVLAAGPIANFVLPVIVYFFFFLSVDGQLPPVIGTVLDDSAAATAALEPGDRVVSIDGKDVRSWEQMRDEIAAAPEKELRVQVERAGRRFDRYVVPRRTYDRDPLGVAEPRGVLGVYPYFYAPQIGIVDADSPAHERGLRTGDIVTSINGEPVSTVEDLERMLAHATDAQIRLTYLRPRASPGVLGTTFLWFESNHAQLLPRERSNFDTGIAPANAFVRAVEEGSPAEHAGMRAGDRVLAVNGRAITRWETVAETIRRAKLDPLTLEVQSLGEEPREVVVTPVERERENIYGEKTKFTWHGVSAYRSIRAPEYEPIRGRFTFAVRKSLGSTAFVLHMQWAAVRQMVTAQRDLDDLSTVIGIAHYADVAFDQGAAEFLMIMAGVSLSLGFVNLLPIPILDGGHILIYTIEAVRRRRLGQRAREIVSAVGLLFILVLMLVALRNDLIKHVLD